jgi:hypothetical protein
MHLAQSPLVLVLVQARFPRRHGIEGRIEAFRAACEDSDYPLFHEGSIQTVGIGPEGPALTNAPRWDLLDRSRRWNVVLSPEFLLLQTTEYHRFRDFLGIKAIYNTLKAQGITYSSTTISFPAGSQKIRYPSASLQEASANCIDGTVLMASAMEAIGLQPLIVLVPGHAFLGWRALDGSTTSEFLETTMIGTSTFEEALNQGTTEFNQHQQAGDAKNCRYCKSSSRWYNSRCTSIAEITSIYS